MIAPGTWTSGLGGWCVEKNESLCDCKVLSLEILSAQQYQQSLLNQFQTHT